MKTLTHWKKLVNPDYIGAYTLEAGKDLTVTIEKVTTQLVTGDGGRKEQCTILKLKNQKPMILNRTNQKQITKNLGTPYIEEWEGKTITLYATVTKLAGEEVECLRVRPATKPPELLETDTTNYNKCRNALKNGYTIQDLKTKWNITPHVEQKLQQP